MQHAHMEVVPSTVRESISMN